MSTYRIVADVTPAQAQAGIRAVGVKALPTGPPGPGLTGVFDVARYLSVATAITALNAAGGGELVIPAGLYSISAQLPDINVPCFIRGAGPGLNATRGTELSFVAGVPGLMFAAGAGGSVLSNIYLKSASSVLGTDDGLSLRAGRIHVHDVVVDGFGRDGVSLDSSVGGTNLNLCTLEHVRSINNERHGFYLDGIDSNLIKLIGTSATSNTNYGYYIDSGVVTTMILAPHADANGVGDFFDNGSSNEWIGLYSEGLGDFRIGASSSFGLLVCGNSARPNIIVDAEGAVTSWTILMGQEWRRNLRIRTLPGDAVDSSYKFTMNSPNNGSVSFIRDPSTRIFEVDNTASRLAISIPLRVDAALDHDGSTVGFYGTTPITKPTGVAVSAAGIHAALVSLGLIAS